MRSKIKKLKCKISNNHKFTTFAIYHTKRIEIQKCDKCGQRKEIPLVIKK